MLRAFRNLERELYRDYIRPPILFCILSDPHCHPRGPDISSMPSWIDSAGTSLMNSIPWHMPMIGRRLIPRISILVRICTLPYSPACDRVDLSRKGTYMWARVDMYACFVDRNGGCQTFWFRAVRCDSLTSHLYSQIFTDDPYVDCARKR